MLSKIIQINSNSTVFCSVANNSSLHVLGTLCNLKVKSVQNIERFLNSLPKNLVHRDINLTIWYFVAFSRKTALQMSDAMKHSTNALMAHALIVQRNVTQ